MEKFEIKQPHENKDIEKDIHSILEYENEFSSWEEKVNYIKLYFLEKKFPEKLKMFFENQSFQKTYFSIRYSGRTRQKGSFKCCSIWYPRGNSERKGALSL